MTLLLWMTTNPVWRESGNQYMKMDVENSVEKIVTYLLAEQSWPQRRERRYG